MEKYKYFIRFIYAQNVYTDSGFDNENARDEAFEKISGMDSNKFLTMSGEHPVIINLANVLTIEKH